MATLMLINSDFGVSIRVEMMEIEGDALSVIKKCQKNYIDQSKIIVFIRDIQQHKSGFQGIWFRHLSRSANQVAHKIAIESFTKGGRNLLGEIRS